jgi:hypothetical protein
MSFGGKGSSYQWEKGTTGRTAPLRLRMPYDQLVRGLIGQMAEPPETPISTPLQQAISNLQSGDVGRAYGLGGGIASRLSGAPDTGGSTVPGGGTAPGFKPGSFLPGAEGGQQGLQTREQLGLPPRESYFPFTPTKADIEAIGMQPVRSQIKGKNELQAKIDRLQTQIGMREAAGRPHGRATRKLEKATTKIGLLPKGPTYRQ